MEKWKAVLETRESVKYFLLEVAEIDDRVSDLVLDEGEYDNETQEQELHGEVVGESLGRSERLLAPVQVVRGENQDGRARNDKSGANEVDRARIALLFVFDFGLRAPDEAQGGDNGENADG